MLNELFETIREEASKDVWSRGVELARQDSVTGEQKGSQEFLLRVFDKSRGVSALITLWPVDLEWNRDCTCKVDPCHHVVAALIALRRAEEQGLSLPQAKSPTGELIYSFTRSEGGLAFERYVQSGDDRHLLNVPLSSLHGRFQELILAPSKHDMAIESALGGERRGKLRAQVMQKLIPLLLEVPVILDEKPCAVHKEALGISVVIRDEGLGIHVIGKRDTRILESFNNGLVLSAEGLHPQAELALDPADRDMLQRGQTIPLRDLERFASERLPQLQRRFRIEQHARNLPSFVEAEPEWELSLERRGQGMVVHTGLVYGDPPIARLVEGVFRPTGSLVPIRQLDQERRLKDELWRQWGLELYQSQYYKTEEALKLMEQLSQWKGRRRGDGFQQFQRYAGQLKPKIQWQDGRLDLSWTLEEGLGSTFDVEREPKMASGTAVLQAWEEKQSLVPLLEGGFASLPHDWMQRYGSIVADLLHAQEGRETLPRALQAQAAQLFEELSGEVPSDLAIFRKLSERQWQDDKPSLPTDFTATLRPYQLQGVSWLQHMRSLHLGALLADDMGLGKTVQTIAVLEGRCLIVAPTSVLPNWKKELQRFRPSLTVSLYHGTQRQWDTKAQVILTSYGLLRQEPERFQNIAWQCIVLDEAQTIKNPESKVAQAAQSLQAPFKLALSGTPVENRLDDLWSLFAFLNPGLLGTRKDFRERWSRPIEEGAEAVAQRLRQMLKPFVLRRLKQEVARDLPPRIEKVLYAELWPEERKLYEAIFAATRSDVVAKLKAGGSVMEALEALLRMRQACCHPALIPQQQAAHSSKLTLLAESLLTALAEDHKALVFSQWTSLLDLLEPILETAGIRYLRLDGSTKDRQDIVDRFQAEDGPPVLIMSLKAGGVGLNLTRADHVFILDPWWNPAAADQAADRAHRIGQDRTVMIHPLVALDSIEEKIMELQNQKRALAAAALGEGNALPTITREDLLFLLGDA